MPIEIKELHIRVAVNGSLRPQSAISQAAAGSGTSGQGESDKDALIAECAEQVLQIIRGKRER